MTGFRAGRLRRALVPGLLVGLLALAGCGGEEAGAAGPGGGPPGRDGDRPPPGVRVVQAELGELERTVDFTGELLADRMVMVAPDEAGRLEVLAVEQGDRVDADALIGRLDDDRQRRALREAEARSRSAEARLEQAEAERDRQANEVARRRPLAERNAFPAAELASLEDQLAVSEQAVAVSEAQLDEARNAVTTARANLDRREIHAPFAGLVAERHVSQGAIVSANVPIVTLVDEASLLMVFPLSEQRLGLVAPGVRATVALDAYPGRTFPAHVAYAGSLIDRVSRTTDVKLALEADGVALRHGMFGRGRLVAERIDAGVIVPPQALQTTREGGTRVWTVVDGSAQPVDVTVALNTPAGAAVEGLEVGATVIVSPPMGLAPGGPVFVVGSAPSTASTPPEEPLERAEGAPGPEAGGTGRPGPPPEGTGARPRRPM